MRHSVPLLLVQILFKRLFTRQRLSRQIEILEELQSVIVAVNRNGLHLVICIPKINNELYIAADRLLIVRTSDRTY